MFLCDLTLLLASKCESVDRFVEDKKPFRSGNTLLLGKKGGRHAPTPHRGKASVCNTHRHTRTHTSKLSHMDTDHTKTPSRTNEITHTYTIRHTQNHTTSTNTTCKQTNTNKTHKRKHESKPKHKYRHKYKHTHTHTHTHQNHHP